MKTIIRNLGMILVLVAGLFSCAAQPAGGQEGTETVIYVNQVGFSPLRAKTAVVTGAIDRFEIVDIPTGKVVFEGKIGSPQEWVPAEMKAGLADFTSFQAPGTYVIRVGQAVSPTFQIIDNIDLPVLKAALKAYYFGRAGYEIDVEHGGEYARAAGHPDTSVGIHPSAVSADRPLGSRISSPGGWYDAGDYNKYIVNSAITVSTLMTAYEHFSPGLDALETDIPESGDATPDILDEVRWNLAWMLSMQDPGDGGVYHKLTSKRFCDMIMPAEDDLPRWVVMKTSSAALTFGASMAQASRVFHDFDPAFSARCLTAAKAAWEWAERHPDVAYVQPQDVQTGTYAQSGPFSDERFWAAAELSLATGEPLGDSLPVPLEVPAWTNGSVLGVMNLLEREPGMSHKKAFLDLADSLLAVQKASAWGISNEVFRWGSSSDFLNQAMIFLYAFRMTGERAYRDAAQANYDWVLGRNPTGYSFLTGFGSRQAMHIHHRPSEADGITPPVPGWVVGGPNPRNKEDCGAEAYGNLPPATAYLDQLCSYATNEIAINWNAPFVYVAAGLSRLP